MIMNTDIEDARKAITENWGDSGNIVLKEISSITPFNGPIKDFLDHCTTCGGNWGGMLLSGLHELYPAVWEAIPEKMGPYAWFGICRTLTLCGVDTKEED